MGYKIKFLYYLNFLAFISMEEDYNKDNLFQVEMFDHLAEDGRML